MRNIWRSTFGMVVGVSLMLAAGTAALGGFVYEAAHEALEQQLDHRISIETQALLGEAHGQGRSALAGVIARREAGQGIASLGYILVDARGRRVAGRLDAVAPARPGYEEFLYHASGTRIAQALTTRLPDGSRLVVAADREVIDQIDRTILGTFALAFAAMLLLGIGGAWVVAALTRSRLREIDRAALAIIDGDLGRRIPLDGSDSEFDRVAATLNRMLDRIGALMENLRQVSSDVAHDLRTPLTRLHHSLDEALAASTDASRIAGIEAAIGQSQDLLEIFAALLRISEIESLNVRERFEPLSLSDVVVDAVDTFQPDAELSNHTISTQVEMGLRVIGDRRLLHQLMANLLDNALHHTPPGTSVSVGLARRDMTAILSIEDDGPGIDIEDVDRIFQRFSRAQRSRANPGHGLGLALGAAIVTAHDGTIAAMPGKGFRLIISLPLAEGGSA